jgi:hypothetical protein
MSMPATPRRRSSRVASGATPRILAASSSTPLQSGLRVLSYNILGEDEDMLNRAKLLIPALKSVDAGAFRIQQQKTMRCAPRCNRRNERSVSPCILSFFPLQTSCAFRSS